MSEPNNIITDYTQVPGTGSWGSYDKENDQWSDKVYSGGAIRLWILKKLAYGPYNSKEEAYAAIPESFRYGFTVGIKDEDGSIKEYQWKTSDLSVDGLKSKYEEYELHIDSITHTPNTDTGEITFTIHVSGRGFGVQTNIFLGPSRVLSMPTLLNQDLVVVIKAPENPGNYTYTVSAVDSILGNGTQLSYEVVWKEVDVKVSKASLIYLYKVKSLLNIKNSSFSFLIYKIDDLEVGTVSVIYGNHELVLYSQEQGEYIANYTVNISDLEDLNSGDLIQIKLSGGTLTKDFLADVVQLTAPGVFSNIQGTIPTSAYNNVSFSATLYFEAENIGNYQVVIKDGSKIIYNSSLLSYNTNTLTLKLEDKTLSETNNLSLHTLNVFIDDRAEADYTFKTITLRWVSNAEMLEDIDEYTKFKDNLDFSELPSGSSLTLTSYILDLSCYIPYIEENSPLFQFGGVTITKDLIQFRQLKYPTPLQQNVSIGFACNIVSSVRDNDYYYDALFINGVLCGKYPHSGSNSAGIVLTSETTHTDGIVTTSEDGIKTVTKISDKIRFYYNTNNAIVLSPESFIIETNYKARNPWLEDSSNLPTFELTPLNNIKSVADLTNEQAELVSGGKITIDGTEYDVINSKKIRVGQFGDIGSTKYVLKTMLAAFGESYGIDASVPLDEDGNVDEKAADTIIETLKKAVKKNPGLIPSNYLTLMRQIVKSKGLLQKYVAVPCEWRYSGTNTNGYCLVFTQGTSTLEYALPNFTFKFYTDKTFSEESNVELVPKIHRTLDNLQTYDIDDVDGYYSEKELVAKADYMESSHLNNTPCAMFYNAITTQQSGYSVDLGDDETTILTNPVGDKLNAIEGFPIILTINGINYGSFMLNIGKSADSIGFGNNGISLEGTSNDDNSGMSSRFDFGVNDTAVKDFFENLTEEDIENLTEEDVENNENWLKLTEFIQGGLEYRYSAADVDDIGGDLDEFKRILKMWRWVYTHKTYTANEFKLMFNFDFCALYYIQMMIFGQTDNLGKNCMFDQFEKNGQWYVRPYDMDSQAGLNNNGVDNLTPAIEISSRFVRDSATRDITTISYLGESTNRFPYSSKTSNLWINFYANLKNNIEIFYGYLRDLGYSAEAIISLCEKEVIDKLKIKQYNIDFGNKYLTNTKSSEQFAYGNRWLKFKDWIQKRFDFCDVYFGYNKYEANTIGDGKTYTIKYTFPQYTIYEYNDASGNSVLTTNWGQQCTLKFDSVTKQFMYFSPKYITDDSGIFLSAFSSMNPMVKLNNLVNYKGTWENLSKVVDLSENTYLQEMEIDGINTTSQFAYIPKSVKKLKITKSTLIPNLEEFPNLTDISFSDCEGDIYLNNCPKLKKITISSCRRINLTLISCGSEDSYINFSQSSTFDQIVINGSYIDYLGLDDLSLNISFPGSPSYIKVTNLQNATINNGELDISNLITDVLLLNHISETKIITRNKKSYKYLGLYYAAITQWGTTADTFDGNMISTDSVKMVDDDSGDRVSDGRITALINGSFSSAIPFRLYNCTRLRNVKNLSITDSVPYLFYNCTYLLSVTDSTINSTGNHMFGYCYNLQTLPVDNNEESTITLADENARYMFHSCQKLDYSDIDKVLDKNTVTKYWNPLTKKYVTTNSENLEPVSACKVTNYDYFMYNKTHYGDTTINLEKYAFATSMEYCFCSWRYSTSTPSQNRNTTENVVITYTGKMPRLVTTISRAFSGASNHRIIIQDPEAFSECSVLKTMDMCFAHTGNRWTINDQTVEYPFVTPRLPNNTGITFNRTFSSSIVDVEYMKDSQGAVYIPSKTTSCYSMFNGATLSQSIEVSKIFSQCTKLTTITNCFRSCIGFTCTSELDISANTVNINVAGVFAHNSNSIRYGFRGTNWYSDPTVSTYVTGDSSSTSQNSSLRVGPYYNTTVTFPNATVSISIVNTKMPMIGVLQGAILDNSDGPIEINLAITAKNCTNFCLNLTLKDTSDTNSVVNINTITSVINGDNAFDGVTILNTSLEITLPDELLTASYMFANSNITKIPSLYQCSGLTNVSHMFENCRQLGINSDLSGPFPMAIGYFLPISVTDVTYMFNGCYRLHGGIPEYFVQVVREITDDGTTTIRSSIDSLAGIFAQTAILYGNVQSYTLNISEMFPNVTNVEGMFYWHTANTSYSGGMQALNAQCFSKCTSCENLFNSASIKIPLNCDFSSATSMRYAFATRLLHGGSSGRNITNLTNISLAADITGIFASDGSTTNEEVLNNLDSLLLLKNGRSSYQGMLYGYGSNLKLAEYKKVTPTLSLPTANHT